ncbi:concanavalin A-like lectin/glucanase domain-containing protein [Mycena haematopus]|nr:concanavalin A-like lectin/glucanase domain-containing protein [Mycena haematopus]
MLVLSTPLPLLLLVLASDGVSAKRQLIRRASHFAARQTTSLARDLRVALARVGVLPRSDAAQSVIFCKNSAQGAVGSAGTSGSGSGSGSGPTGGAAGNGSASGSPSTGTGTAAGATATSTWHLTQSYAGSTFFDGWDFWDTSDPTHGTVQYLSQTDGQNAGLVQINDAGNAVMRVETTPTVASTRKSIRITTQQSFTGGLIIMDAVHMPTGCATWPAFWSDGPDWPTGGEIDIVEGVNNYTANQATIHTAPGCNLPTDSPAQLGASAAAVTGGTDCAAATSMNAGCGMRSTSTQSFGPGFNSNGGGVYAMQWDSSGISVYFFARGSVPSDIGAGTPEPTTWGLPMARWPAADCNPWTYFYTHVAIFDTTLCGDWAGSVWTQSGAAPGQDVSCATQTGFSTCEAFVQGSGASFAEACASLYWEVASVKFYNTTAPL